MQTPVQITFRHMDSSPALKARVLEHVQHLERFRGRLIGCHVIVETPSAHQRNGMPFQITVELKVPGRDIHAHSNRSANDSHADVYVALRDTFESAKRQLLNGHDA